ncbi:MAG TPA: MlaD family protein [Methylomirabilota bacterium]|nr:MlaD family protein [Methylomirabilota bacterium]
MNDERSELGRKLRVGTFILVALAAFLGMIYALGAKSRLFEAKYTIHAEFTEVGGLAEGATVRLAGVQIGRVSEVNLPGEPGGKVRVDLAIAERFADRVRKDSIARIETQGLLGDKIVEITVGSAAAPATQPGDTIASRDPADIGQVVSQGAQTVKDVAAVAATLRETAEGLQQSRLLEDAGVTMANARKLTDQIARIVDQVERGKGWANALIYQEPVALRRLDGLIATTQALLDRVERGEGAVGVLTSDRSTASARRLVAAMDRLARAVERPGDDDAGLLPALLMDPKYKSVLEDVRVVARNFREVSDRLAGGRGTLGSLVKDEPGEAGIRQASQDLQVALANLREITAKINEGEGTVGALIADPTVYERLVSILDGASRSRLLRGLLRGLGGGDRSRTGGGEGE